MPTVPAAAARRSETPNAVMTTLASPTLGATRELALWRVRMEAGGAGPEHVFDSEQVWTVVSGAARVTVDGEQAVLAAGDTIVLPAGATRRIRADGELEALVAGRAGARVTAAGHDGVTPPWIA
jgi:quercetin dioxygenase-like cupin family protein